LPWLCCGLYSRFMQHPQRRAAADAWEEHVQFFLRDFEIHA
jgi:hypothetical protein